MRRLASVVVAVTVLGMPAAASAHPISHPGPPIVRNLRPAFGEVVPAGPVSIAAQVVCNVAITSWTLRVDGSPVAASAEGSDPSHPTIVGQPVTLAPGDHLAQLDVVGSDGRTGGRAWRISASGLPVRRLAGADRIGTAVAVSRDLYPGPTPAGAAVISRADDFADALAGAALAQHVDGPVLLTDRSALSAATADELRRVLAPGSTVYLLGGPAALTPQVESDVTAAGFLVNRVAGDSRAGTAAAVAALLGAVHGAIVVNGDAFADALGASSPSAANQLPVLLTARDSVPPETSQFISGHNLDSLYVVGGETAVSAATASQLASMVGGRLTRIAGGDRWSTAVAVARQFFRPGAPLSIASGVSFPDALSGGRRAAALNGPMLLAPPGGLADLDATGSLQPSSAVLFGGAAALGDAVAGDIRRAAYDVGAPRPTGSDPAPGTEVHSLNSIAVSFGRALNTAASDVYVSMDGEEVPGAVTSGDFPDTLVFNATQLPVSPAVGQPVDVRVVVAAFDGTAWRHLDQHLVYRKLDISLGDGGNAVGQLQQRLLDLGYWIDKPDGQFGDLTQQAVYAFQKVQGLPRTGAADAPTRAALADATRPVPRTGGGYHVEIDKARQVVLLVSGGRVTWAFNTSTGTEQPYNTDGHTGVAHTPTGTFSISRQVDGSDNSPLGVLWRPKYFTSDGVAIHGSPSVPPYPASHGCVRVTFAAIDWMWGTNALPLGTTVIVY